MTHFVDRSSPFYILKCTWSIRKEAFNLLSKQTMNASKLCNALAFGSKAGSKRASIRGFQLQAEVPKDAPPIKGFNVVMQRVANIILNITERQPSNILHVYPENALVSYLGPVWRVSVLSVHCFDSFTFQVTHIDISGLSNSNIHHEKFK